MEIHNSFPSKWWWWCRDFFHQFTCRKRIFFSSQKNFFSKIKSFQRNFPPSPPPPTCRWTREKKKRGRGATVHWQSRRMQMTGCALGRLTKKKKEKKRNQSCWFPSSSCRLEKKKKSHFHLPTSAAGRLFISRLRSERHDPADKFQSSSFAYSSASSLFFFFLFYCVICCLCAIGAASNSGRLPATNHRPNFIGRQTPSISFDWPGEEQRQKAPHLNTSITSAREWSI